MLYEIVSATGVLVATLPAAGPSPQLLALRMLYDLSGCNHEPLTLWRLTFGGSVEAFPICALCRQAVYPLPEC